MRLSECKPGCTYEEYDMGFSTYFTCLGDATEAEKVLHEPYAQGAVFKKVLILGKFAREKVLMETPGIPQSYLNIKPATFPMN